MKKILSILLVFLLMICSSCLAQQNQPSDHSPQAPTMTETSALPIPSEQVTEIKVSGVPNLYDDINSLVGNSEIIIIGTIEEALPVVRIEAVSLGLASSDTEYYKNVSSYQVRIEQVFKGDFSAGELFRVDRNGGLAEGIYENLVGMNYPVEGSKYLMFIDETSITDKTDYFMYMFEGTFDGFSEIIDGKLYPQENTSIFKTGMFVEDATAEIVSALKTANDK